MAKKADKKVKDTGEEIEKDVAAAAALAKPTKKSFDWQMAILLFAFMACALAFLPTTLLFFFGLMPTFAALVMDPTPDKIKTLSVGAMNIAGIVPFLLKLWTSGEAQSIDTSFRLIAQPETLITMYGAAAVGYVIFYSVSGLVATLLLQQGRARLEDVKKRMLELERKWGSEVTGSGSSEDDMDFLEDDK